MRLTLEELMEKLGVDRPLTPYETQPWFMYDEDKGITCSAEVRMGPNYEDLETEIQFIYDDDREREIEVKVKVRDRDGKDVEETKTETIRGGQEHIMYMQVKPVIQQKWTTTALKVKGESYYNKFHNWEGKGCDFFRAAIEAIQMNILPDIDDLIEKELSDDALGGGGRRGRIGRKSPKVKPGQLMGMKK